MKKLGETFKTKFRKIYLFGGCVYVLPVEKDAEASFGREKTTLEKVELIVILVQQTDAGGVSRRCPHGLDYMKK